MKVNEKKVYKTMGAGTTQCQNSGGAREKEKKNSPNEINFYILMLFFLFRHTEHRRKKKIKKEEKNHCPFLWFIMQVNMKMSFN